MSRTQGDAVWGDGCGVSRQNAGAPITFVASQSRVLGLVLLLTAVTGAFIYPSVGLVAILMQPSGLWANPVI